MNIYEAPIATPVRFETANIIATSDVFDMLITWGKSVGEADSGVVDFYK